MTEVKKVENLMVKCELVVKHNNQRYFSHM